MKVLHVIPAVSPRYGGPSKRVLPMCRALLAQGVDVQIATTDAEPGGHIQVELGISHHLPGNTRDLLSQTMERSIHILLPTGSVAQESCHGF